MYPLPRNENFWDFCKNETLWWQKMGKSCESGWNWPFWVNLSLILGKRWKNMLNDQNWPFWANPKPFFLAKFTIVGHFEPLQCETIQKSWKTQNKLLMYPTLEWRFLRFQQKWDILVTKDGKSCESGEIGHSESIWASFWGKRWKNMLNEWNWPFWANPKPLFLAKFAIVGHFELLQFDAIQKSWKTQKICQCIPPWNENFWDFYKNEMLWWQKMGKVVNRVKLVIPSKSEPRFGGKRWENMQNDQNWLFWANLSHFLGNICHCGSFCAASVWYDLKKLKNSKKIAGAGQLKFCWDI